MAGSTTEETAASSLAVCGSTGVPERALAVVTRERLTSGVGAAPSATVAELGRTTTVTGMRAPAGTVPNAHSIGPDPPPLGFFNSAPSVLGQTFDGPMPGHNSDMPWHYDLHVWFWEDNPGGLFAPFNSALSC